MGLVEQAMSTKKSVCWWWCRGWYKSRLLHAINFWSYREVRSEAATGTSPTETLGGWGTLHPSKQLSLPRGQHQQYPIHYKGQRKKEGGKQGRERNNKHLFTVTGVTFSAIFFMIYDWLWKAWGELIGSGEFKKEALVLLWKHLRSCFSERAGIYKRIRDETFIILRDKMWKASFSKACSTKVQ